MASKDGVVRVGQVGLGKWGNQLATAASKSQKIQFAAGFSRSEEKRKAYAEKYGMETESSYEDLLGREDIEGVVISAPNNAHTELCIRAAEAGKHVFVEKPITNHIPEARQVVAACEKAGVTLMVGHGSRRLGGHRVQKEWIEGGKLGEVVMIDGNISNTTGMAVAEGAWLWYKKESPAGALTQLGVHHVDTFLYLGGPVKRVSAFLGRKKTRAEIPDVTSTLLEFESGVQGYVGSNFASARWTFFVNVYGTEGNLYYDRFDGLYHKVSDEPRGPVPYDNVDILQDELEHFAHCLRNGAQPETGGKEGIDALAVVVAAIRSAEEGRAVEIAEVMAG
ncbi:MAG: Gfo/Idh/MocA family protein [Nitrospinota bacterium]